MVPIEDRLWVANMVAQHGVGPDGHRRPPIRYEALAKCLQTVARHANTMDASVHMPRIGCGLAGGDWFNVAQLVRTHLCGQGIRVTVYDLPSRNVPNHNQGRGRRW